MSNSTYRAVANGNLVEVYGPQRMTLTKDEADVMAKQADQFAEQIRKARGAGDSYGARALGAAFRAGVRAGRRQAVAR
jgi:hypothetical protein